MSWRLEGGEELIQFTPTLEFITVSKRGICSSHALQEGKGVGPVMAARSKVEVKVKVINNFGRPFCSDRSVKRGMRGGEEGL